MEQEISMETPLTVEMIAFLTMLSLFTVVGSVGNGLVLFVFSRVRDKTTAQLFILALALIDLFTCMVIIPLTMYVEYTRYDIKYDFMCKLYQFLITSKVPLSAFIMVAIAFDRYFCICHPLRKIITPWRTKVIIVSLTMFASMLGVMTSLAYGVYQIFNLFEEYKHNGGISNATFTPSWNQIMEPDPASKSDVTMTVELRMKSWLSRKNFTSFGMHKHLQEFVYIGVCAPNEILLSWGFVYIYQKCYTALFLICLVIVGILYGMIYRFIGLRRKKKLQQRLVLCAYVNGENGCAEAGTRTTMVNGNGHDNQNEDYVCNSQGLGAGGVYIGVCSSPPAYTKAANHGGANVSFFNEGSVSEKIALSKDGRRQYEFDDMSSKLKNGNVSNRLSGLDGSENDSYGRGENSHFVVNSGPEFQHSNERLGKESNTDHLPLPEDEELKVTGRIFARKSPSPNSSRFSKNKGLCKNNRRPRSLMEGTGSKEEHCAVSFRKRRGSCPFRKEHREGKSGEKIELRALRSRRGSEPLKIYIRDFSPVTGRRFANGVEEDVLTMGSRNTYNDSYLETSIEEDYNRLATNPSSLHISCSSAKAPVVSADDIPVLSMTMCDSDDELGKVIDKRLPKISNEKNEESSLPLLCESADIDPVRENVTLGSKECSIPGVGHSQMVAESSPYASDWDSTCPSPSRDDLELRSSPSILNNRCAQLGTQQQTQLTTYVRNLNPGSYTTGANLSPRPSYSDSSRRSTMETGSFRRSGSESTSRLTLDPPSRSTMGSRRSTMDSAVRRPVTGRKKRWQHFRCKNASIKGSHGRNHHGSGVSSRSRSVMSLDADRLREENRAANARTALMLFTVTLVFVVAFLPAWLMAHQLVPNHLVVFYLYFTYNVANPFIYAFMNVIFKDHLRKIFTCRNNR